MKATALLSCYLKCSIRLLKSLRERLHLKVRCVACVKIAPLHIISCDAVVVPVRVGARSVVQEVRAQHALAISDEDLPILADRVAAAAQKSLDSYMKHVAPQLESMERRFCFDCRLAPADMAKLVLESDWDPHVFFGTLETDSAFSSTDLEAEYMIYSQHWRKHAELTPTHPVGKSNFTFWTSTTSQALWPNLAKCALYWLEFPTSSIAAERAIAVGRVVDEARRRCMSSKTFKRELFLRCNQEIVKELLETSLIRFR